MTSRIAPVLGALAALAVASAAVPPRAPAPAAHPAPRTPPTWASAAGAAGSADTLRLTDDLGRTLVFAAPPTRIASLIPAATEILFAIGAGGRVSARSRFDDQPPQARERPSLGDAIRPSVERIVAHGPDVLLLFAGPDNEPTVRELDRLGVPTLAIALNSLADLERAILRLGRLTGRETEAAALRDRIRGELEEVRRRTAGAPPRTVYYDIWYPPPITVGSGSYLDTLIAIAGGRNVFGDLEPPSPRVSLEAIVARDPDLVLHPVSRDPAARQTPPAERPGWEAIRAVREGDVRAVDADLLHRLGPRIGRGAAALARAIHPPEEGRGVSPAPGGRR